MNKKAKPITKTKKKKQNKKEEKELIELLPNFFIDQVVFVKGGFYKGKIGEIRDFFPGIKEEGSQKVVKKSLYLLITQGYEGIYVYEEDIKLV